MNIDFLAVSGYKWLNNVFGTGFGYASKKDHREDRTSNTWDGSAIQTGWTTLLSSLTLLVELEDTKPEDVTGLA